MANLKAGAQLYTVRAFTKTVDGVADTFRKVRAIGYEAVQVSGFGPMEPQEVARLAGEHGLEIAATHFGWDDFRNDLDRVIETHQLWGCRHPAIGGLPKEYHSADGVKRFVDELGPIAERLAAAGMDFSYHNHSHELVRYGEQTWLAALYGTAPAEMLKAELDLYWLVAGGGDPVQWIRDLGPRQPLVHFKDMRVLPDRTQRFAPVGEGNLNWPLIVAACREVGAEWALVEQDDSYGADPFEELATSYRNMRAMGID